MKSKMKKIGILTSGGDAPGMNAAVRAIVRTALSNNIKPIGINRGFRGIYEKDFVPLSSRNVANLIKAGGTFLETSRFPELKDEKVCKDVADIIKKENFDSVFIIGGNGSLRGANALSKFGANTIVLPGSIDNDIPGTEMSIGVDTALNTILYAVDRIKDTASSNERTFLIEVMGRGSGYLALMACIATGADYVIIPEFPINIDEIISMTQMRKKEHKKNTIIIVAEGAIHVEELEKKLKKKIPWEIRKTILGHIQRGGSPTAYDRVLATRLGRESVEQYLMGNANVLIGYSGTTYKITPISQVVNMVKPAPANDIKTVRYMST